jgi:recombination protein RecA
MSTKLAKMRAALKKNKKVNMVDNRVVLDPNKAVVHDVISTGSLILNHLIGGNRVEDGRRQCPGIPKGRIIEIYGPYGSGKTTVALETARQCQQGGGSVVFLDYENALDPAYARKLGVSFDEDKWDLYAPATWEEGVEIINMVAELGVDLVIVDSVSAMIPEKLYEKDLSEQGRIGLLAALQSTFLPRIVPALRKSGTSLIYLNQLRSRIKLTKWDKGPDEDTSGGRAGKFYASLRIALDPIRQDYGNAVYNELTGEEEKQPIANLVRATITKTKVSAHQQKSADFWLRYGEGIDNVRSVVDISEARGLLTKSGSWYKFFNQQGEEIKLQGYENLREHLISHDADLQALITGIGDIINKNGQVGTVDDVDEDTYEEDE